MPHFRDLAIARKLVISMMLTTGLALGLATAGFTAHQIAEFRQSVNARVTSLAESLGANSAGALAFQDEDAAGRIVRSVEGQAYIVIACLYVPEGSLIAEYRRDAAVPCPAHAEAFAAVGDSPLRHLSAVDYEGDSVGSVGLVADQEELFANLRDYAATAAGLLLAALAAAWILAFRLQHLIADPLLHLVSVAKTVTERRDYSMRAVPSSQDEVGLLGRTFNNMLDQLETDAEERTLTTRDLKAARDKAEAASRAKSSFLATMSHEIRTPMNGITGMTTLLLNSPLDADQRECAEVVQRSTDSLLRIINDILDFSRIEAGKVVIVEAPVALEQVILDVVDLLRPKAQQKHIDLLTLYPPGLPRRFLGDTGRLRQIILNLAGNAVKFTESGHALIKVDFEPSGERGSLVHVTVEDSGPGIPEHLREELFDKFTRADNSTTRTEGGTGLGLAISRQLAELMGGTIRVEDAPGGGARFVLSVPLALDPSAAETETTDDPNHLRVLAQSAREETLAVLRGQLGPVVAAVEVAIASSQPPGAAYRVLVAEDNAVNQEVTTKLVEHLGGHVDVVPNGRDAVRMARAEAYDLVLMDCQMPELDGYEATAEIRRLEGASQHVPIVAMTANAMTGDRERCLAAGMDDYVTKPVKLSGLADVVARWVHGATTAAPSPEATPSDGGDARLGATR